LIRCLVAYTEHKCRGHEALMEGSEKGDRIMPGRISGTCQANWNCSGSIHVLLLCQRTLDFRWKNTG